MKIYLIKIISLFILLLSNTVLYAGDWTKSLNIAVIFNQSMSKTNASGDIKQNSGINYGLLINGDLTSDNEKRNWKNTLKLEYARSRSTSKIGSTSTTSTDWTEDIDKLTLDSIHRWKVRKYINPYCAANLQTTMLDAEKIKPEWKAFRHVQLRESAGIGSPIIDKKNQQLIGRLGIYIEHFVNAPSYQQYNSSNGIELVFDYKNKLNENSDFTSKLGLYSSLKETNDPAGVNWNVAGKSKKIKMEFDNTLISKLTKYLNVVISYSVRNIDIAESKAHFEWEEKLNLAFNYKVF